MATLFISDKKTRERLDLGFVGSSYDINSEAYMCEAIGRFLGIDSDRIVLDTESGALEFSVDGKLRFTDGHAEDVTVSDDDDDDDAEISSPVYRNPDEPTWGA